MKQFFSFILLISCGYFSYSQQQAWPKVIQPTDDTFHWNAGRKLTWEDFKGIPDTSDKAAAASTASTLGYNYTYTPDTTFHFFTYAIFVKNYSWVKEGWDRTAYELNHEQRHFDITEIYARKLAMAFKRYKLNKNDRKRIYDSLSTEWDKIQDLYDKETKHSINIEKQKEWDKKIDGLLKEYERK